MTTVAYQGEPGAFGEEAVVGWFASEVTPVSMPTFNAVCAAVESGRADAGVLPLENSLAGTVGDALDALATGSLQVIGEVLLPVRHQLLVVPGADLREIRAVSSHWQALAQCERYLARNGWTVIAAADTAGAARDLAASGAGDRAAIASRRAAERYGLEVAAANIQDADDNVTRFAILAAGAADVLPAPTGPLVPRGGGRETLVTFETGHRPGDLHRALGAFADAGINLSRIESRPSGEGRWRYRFLVQVSGDAGSEPLRGALEAMTAHTRSMRVLGTFDAAPVDD
jgi:prephenate dehydratase